MLPQQQVQVRSLVGEDAARCSAAKKKKTTQKRNPKPKQREYTQGLKITEM